MTSRDKLVIWGIAHLVEIPLHAIPFALVALFCWAVGIDANWPILSAFFAGGFITGGERRYQLLKEDL